MEPIESPRRLTINFENISDLHKMLEFIDKSKFTILTADNCKTMSLGYLIFNQEDDVTELMCVAPIYDNLKPCKEYVLNSQKKWINKLRSFELETESIIKIVTDPRKLLLGFSVYPERKIYWTSVKSVSHELENDSIFLFLQQKEIYDTDLDRSTRMKLFGNIPKN